MSVFKKPNRALVTGGLFVIVPLIVLIVFIRKAIEILSPLGERIESGLHIHSVFGKATIDVICLLLLLVLCYIAGLMLRFDVVKRTSAKIEENLFLFLPGLRILKYHLSDEEAIKTGDDWTAILLKDDDHYVPAFITSETEGHLSLFLPDAPNVDAGEVRYLKKEECNYIIIPMRDALRSFSSFGKNTHFWDKIRSDNQ